ncbi:MAG: TfoX/Sxy family protein [Cryomorphaceae bacterium]
MNASDDQTRFILDQLQGFGEITTKRMFGGVGFFHEGLMFGMIAKGIFRLKVGDKNRSDFESRGMTAYMSSAKKKGMPYYEVPIDVLEDRAEFLRWSRISWEIADAAAKK